MKCTNCDSEGHNALWPGCPGRKLVYKAASEPTKVKEPWVKPTLTKVHLIPAVRLTETKEEMINRLSGNVRLTEFDRKKYQREYMRGKRANVQPE